MKLYYLREICTAYSSARSAMTSLAQLSPAEIERLADNYAYYDYVQDLPIDKTPASKLEYILNRSEELFEEAEPENGPFWMIETLI